MTDIQLPPPSDLDAHPRVLIGELEAHVGNRQAALWCAELLAGADPHDYLGMFTYLAGRATEAALEGISWKPYWTRTWGARGLRYVWVDDAAYAIVVGLGDEHWRPAEMCLKVAALREVGEAGPGALAWLDHELPRVRAAACRALGVVGDTEHVDAVLDRLDDEAPDVRRAASRALATMSRRLDLTLDIDLR